MCDFNKSDQVLFRIGDLEFRPAEIPTAPPAAKVAGSGSKQRRIAGLWNNYGAEIHRQSALIGLPIEAALVVFAVEAGGSAYDQDTGLIIIRFESHLFKRRTGEELPSMRRQPDRWDVLKRAAEIDLRQAVECTSWGLPQLMGFNYKVTPHESPEEMALALQRSVVEQVAGFFGFVRHNGLEGPIKRRDWRTFARRYNGSGQVDHYSRVLSEYWTAIESMKADGVRFE